MQLSKTERILAIINFFLPHTDLYQYRFEADSIAYNTRKNSSLKTIEKLIREYLPNLEDDIVHQWQRQSRRVCGVNSSSPPETQDQVPSEQFHSCEL